jgi:hypothetical protein
MSTFMSGISEIMITASATMGGPINSKTGLAVGATVHSWLVQSTRDVSGRTTSQ